MPQATTQGPQSLPAALFLGAQGVLGREQDRPQSSQAHGATVAQGGR